LIANRAGPCDRRRPVNQKYGHQPDIEEFDGIANGELRLPAFGPNKEAPGVCRYQGHRSKLNAGHEIICSWPHAYLQHPQRRICPPAQS